jgi:ABC-type Fe3+-siderophore transport system permease subunit
MNLMIAYWIFCISLVVATVVMLVGLVGFVMTIVEQIQRIMLARRVRD